jgi:hypothetical protein
MLAGEMLAQAGFRWLFWADAATCAAFAVLAWRAIPAAQTHPQARRSKPSGFGSVLRDRAMAVFALVTLSYMAVCQQAHHLARRHAPTRAAASRLRLSGDRYIGPTVCL